MSTERTYLQTLLDEISTGPVDTEVLRLMEQSDSRSIHPIFSRDRWNVDDVDYLFISPALVLASHLLTSDRATHFWHALWLGQHVPHRDKYGMERVQSNPIFDTNASLPPIEKTKVLRLLDEMSLAIRLRFTNTGIDDGRCCSGGPLHEIPFFAAAGMPPSCRQSTIEIKTSRLEELKSAKVLSSKQKCLRRWLTIACTLVHEVAHAASFAFRGLGREGFFGKQTFSEMGFALEKWLFDGRLGILWNILGDEVLVVKHLPSLWTIKGYRRQGLFPLLGFPDPEAELVGTVSHLWLEALFDENTWTNVVPKTNASALAPPAARCLCRACTPKSPGQQAVPADLTLARAPEMTEGPSPEIEMVDADAPELDEEDDYDSYEDLDPDTWQLVVDHHVVDRSEVCGEREEYEQAILSLSAEQMRHLRNSPVYVEVMEIRKKYSEKNIW